MSVYFIASYDVKDENAYNDYIVAVERIFQKYRGKLLVVDENSKVIEGDSKMVNVIIEFASEEEAMNFYNDPEYTSVKQIRINATKNISLVLAKALSDLAA